MNHLKIFIELTRLNKPIGFMLLFWPCAWGLAFAYNKNQNTELFLFYIFLFFLGSVLMRSAGCIFNDIVDIDYDKMVERTKERPLASGKITIKRSMIYVIFICFLSLIILIQFNYLTILLGLGSMILAFSYPFMKRITYWPQLFLGLTFNWGIIMAWASISNDINIQIILLYISAIFWTLGYDTIYGAQDISDDEIIGLKSTSVKFKNKIKMFVATAYSITILTITYLFRPFIGLNLFSLLLILFFLSLIYQVIKFNKDDPASCLSMFKYNNYSGLILFLSIINLDAQ